MDASYRLVGLGAALVTGVSGDGHHWLDLGGPGHDTPHVDQLPDAVGPNVTHHFGFGGGGGLEIKLAGGEATQLVSGKDTGGKEADESARVESYSQSPHQLRRVLVPWVSGVRRVPAPLLHHQPVLDVNIQGVFGHNLVQSVHL